MRILYVHNVGKIGGAERVTLDIIRGLDKKIHQAFLVAPEDGRFLAAAREQGAEASVLAIQQPDIRKPLATLASYRLWIDYLEKNRIDLIHTGDLFVTRSLIRPTNKLGIPLVCHIHFPIEAPALRWIFSTKPKCCHFVYCSQELHDTVAPRIDSELNSSSHHVIHNGVDTEQFKPFVPQKNFLPDDKINIGIVANLQERKGHYDLIEAISLVYPEYKNILVHVIGGDLFGESRETQLKQRVADLGLSEVFVFHGQVNNVADYLNELDIIVCASHEEAFPISMLESMAFGLPIVSTAVNGIPEAIDHNVNGLLFPSKDPKAMAKVLQKLLDQPDEGRRLGNRARADVAEQFGLSVFSEKFREIYKQTEKHS